jgi:hypothetical protein
MIFQQAQEKDLASKKPQRELIMAARQDSPEFEERPG